jgi:glycosyltransferase involved in cell wall biosynthesis
LPPTELARDPDLGHAPEDDKPCTLTSEAPSRADAGVAICAVVPAFNEEHTVAQVVRETRAAIAGVQVIVVDDGSQDRTTDVARAAGAEVVRLAVNLGIGGAVQAGFQYALRNGFDIAMQIDGDGQHDAFEAARILEPVMAGRSDMVVGSRWLGRGDYVAPTGRRTGMRLLSRLVRWRCGSTFTDTTSGFRAVGRSGIALFARNYPTDFPEVEALIMARRAGLRVEEVPVHMNQRSHGRSSIAGLRSSYYMARVCVALIVDALGRKKI